ncbi:Integrase, catalytic core [Cucumis melo var. makuwa]|uniref:DNA-directed DNA polymerase n=1 Tax=Cucumis melo var. makuwa TaxID=1194695 RepID=A0A5A7V3X8_CUCMM|nr:Integrase, catalytic core [Cucumis melo var. makuwa]
MVSERDIEQTLDNTTRDGNKIRRQPLVFAPPRCSDQCYHVRIVPINSAVVPATAGPPRVAAEATRVGPSSSDSANHPICIAAIEVTLETTSNTSISMYSENPVTSFPTLSSSYVTNTEAQSTRYHLSGEKLNDNNYFSCKEPRIAKTSLYVATSKDIWDMAQTLHSKRHNASRLYMLRKQEMELCKELVWSNLSDDLQYSRIEEIDRISDFLAGLNPRSYKCYEYLQQLLLLTPMLLVKVLGNDKHNGKLVPVCKKCFLNDKQNTGRTCVSLLDLLTPPDPHRNQIDPSPTILYVIVQSGYLGSSMVHWPPLLKNGRLHPVQGSPYHLSFRKMIATAQHSRELYLLDDDTSSSCISRTSLISSYFTTSEQDCMLLNNIRSLFLYNHTNQPILSLLSIVMSEIIQDNYLIWFAIWRSDNGREFQDHTLNEFLSSKGIVHQRSCAYSPQQNMVAKRKNCHLLKVACSLMFSTSLPCDVVLLHPVLARQSPRPTTGWSGGEDGSGNANIRRVDRRRRVSASSLQSYSHYHTKPDPHHTILLTNQVPLKTYYKRNLRKEVRSPTNQPAPIQDSELLQDPSMTDSLDSHIDSKMIENDKSKTAILENIGEQGNVDLPIALRKGCPKWKNVVMEEMRTLEKNKTLKICALPKGHKIAGCKWVFALKYKAEGTLDRYKARLVAKGFTQTYDVDDSETFSPVAKLNAVRVLLYVAMNKDWPLYQLDVKNAFLNEDLEVEVYMSPPSGFEAKFSHQKDHAKIIQLKKMMGDEFEIKDLGNLKYFLGIEVARSRKGISVSQKKYTLDLLTETDISFALSTVSQFMQAPSEEHMEAVNRILRYLKTTPRKGLMFRKTGRKTIEAYTDSDWTWSTVDRKSTSSYYTFVWNNLVTWRSKKQGVMARSSVETDYGAMSLRIYPRSIPVALAINLNTDHSTHLAILLPSKTLNTRQPMLLWIISDLYESQLEAKKRGDEPMTWIYKVLMNSLYGRFGINPKAEKLTDYYYVVNYSSNSSLVDDHDWKAPWMSAVQLAAAVTACARTHMYPYISRPDCYYTNTDSIILGSPLPDDLISPMEMGKFKLENHVKKCIFLAPNSYTLSIEDKDKEDKRLLNTRVLLRTY